MARRARDAAELERQKLARQRFRSLIRSVVYNRIWLNDADDLQKVTMNVKRNVAMLIRRKHKIGVLTMAEKALIRTHYSLRSLADRKQLLKLVADMQCFSKLPPQVRARLCSVIKFLYINSGRVIIREGGFPDTIYFILYGEVEASRKVFDSMKGEYVEKVEFIYGPGDCIGDIEMIERCPRKHTYIANSVVEMLVVFGHDFERILRNEMTKQWNEKLASIKALGYFDHFNDEQNSNVNKLSVLREFDALETIYHEDKGEASYAYFVLSGECMILQSLQLKVREKWGVKSYELVDISKVNKEPKFVRKSAMQFIKQQEKVSHQRYDIDKLLESEEEQNTDLSRIKKALKVMDIQAIETQCDMRKKKLAGVDEVELVSEPTAPTTKMTTLLLDEEELLKSQFEARESERFGGFEGVNDVEAIESFESMEGIQGLEGIGGSEGFGGSEGIEEHSSTGLIYTRTTQTSQKAKSIVSFKTLPGENGDEEKVKDVQEEDNKQTQLSTTVEEFQSQARGPGDEQKAPSRANSDVAEKSIKSYRSSANSHKSVGSAERNSKLSKGSKESRSFISKKEPIYRVERRFIDVGSLSFGGIFGLGEKFEDRVIMARTKVQCLLIPRFWLFEKEQNPGRIWQRRRFVIQTGIPSRLQLYRDFLNTRKWQKYKNNFISSILGPSSNQNETHLEDIPMMFHIINPIDE